MAVIEKLRTNGHLEKTGVAYPASVMESVTSTSSIEYYAKLIREKAHARELILAAQKVVAMGLEKAQTSRS